MNRTRIMPGIYRDTRGNRQMMMVEVDGKCVSTFADNLKYEAIRVWVVSPHRFRYDMTLERTFEPDELRGYLARIIAHGPRRLCNRSERELLFTAEGRERLAAAVDHAFPPATAPASTPLVNDTTRMAVSETASPGFWSKLLTRLQACFNRESREVVAPAAT
jgi:hypothetical protein